MPPLAEITKQLGGAFPEFAAALSKPLADLGAQKATYGVLDILLNARAPSREVRAVATKWSAFADESGNSKTALEVFERLHAVEPDWEEAQQARARLLLHLNRPIQALRLVEGRSGERFDQLRGVCHVRTDPKLAEKLLADARDYVNLAALVEFQGGDATEIWEKAVKVEHPSMAALNGAKRFDEALKREAPLDATAAQNDFEARLAQALIGLGAKARDELFAVTSEGLFRTAISKIEKCSNNGKKPVHAIELCRGLEEYAALLKKWDKREKEPESLRTRAEGIRNVTSSFLPSFSFELKGWTIDS